MEEMILKDVVEINNEEFVIIKEIDSYVYMFKEDNPKNIKIMKDINDEYLELSELEYEKALLLFYKSETIN